jgi:kynureninase
VIDIQQQALRLDEHDALKSYKARFELPEATIYLDGNSLGPLSIAALQALNTCARDQWGKDLIKSWNIHDWIGLPQRIGAALAPLLGATQDQLIVCDSVSVNLFKLLTRILSASERNRVLLQADNFPTDNYVAQGLAEFARGDILLSYHQTNDIVEHLDSDVAAVVLSHVNYKTGERYDIKTICQHAHQTGALVICDLAHSAGVLNVDLQAWQVDFAVGCGYKYLNGGPGAPGFIYAARPDALIGRSALQGWMGHQAPFAFDHAYSQASDMRSFLVGTPPVLSMTALLGALTDFQGITLLQLEQKALALGDLFLTSLSNLGLDKELRLVTPREHAQRGAQLSFEHEHAYALCQALIAEGVIGDFRAPNVLRFGFSPLFLSFADVVEAALKLREIVRWKSYLDERFLRRNTVT